MKTYNTYECEICGYHSSKERDVLRCEAQGFPPPPVLPADFEFNKKVKLYGRYGVKIAKVIDVSLVNAMGCPGSHSWVITLDREVNVGDSDWEHNGSNRDCWDHYLNPDNLDYCER